MSWESETIRPRIKNTNSKKIKCLIIFQKILKRKVSIICDSITLVPDATLSSPFLQDPANKFFFCSLRAYILQHRNSLHTKAVYSLSDLRAILDPVCLDPWFMNKQNVEGNFRRKTSLRKKDLCLYTVSPYSLLPYLQQTNTTVYQALFNPSPLVNTRFSRKLLTLRELKQYSFK